MSLPIPFRPPALPTLASATSATSGAIMLANQFSAFIRRDLSTAQLIAANTDNAARDYDPAICATHDFIDANQTMVDALDAIGLRYPYAGEQSDAEVSACTELINTAWSLAKRHQFRPIPWRIENPACCSPAAQADCLRAIGQGFETAQSIRFIDPGDNDQQGNFIYLQAIYEMGCEYYRWDYQDEVIPVDPLTLHPEAYTYDDGTCNFRPLEYYLTAPLPAGWEQKYDLPHELLAYAHAKGGVSKVKPEWTGGFYSQLVRDLFPPLHEDGPKLVLRLDPRADRPTPLTQLHTPAIVTVFADKECLADGIEIRFHTTKAAIDWMAQPSL